MGNKKKKSDDVQLNRSQKEAIYLPSGIHCVIAGAGTGKTKVLTQRIIYLVNDLGIELEKILAITFTKKAAREISNRLTKALGSKAACIHDQTVSIKPVSTIHSFCRGLLNEKNKESGSDKKTRFLKNESERNELIENACTKNHLSANHLDKNLFSEIVQSLRLNGVITEKIIQDVAKRYQEKSSADQKLKETEKIARSFLYELKEKNYSEYSELLVGAYKLLKENEAVRLKWQKYFDCILVDEFQDVDSLQYEIISILAAVKKNLFVVGDSDQSIYSWRGAIPNIEKKFERDFPTAKVLMLTQNYRCSKKILKIANALIKHNQDRTKKKLFSKIKHKAKVVYYHASSQNEEAKWVVDQIEQLLNVDDELIFKNIAIIYRDGYCANLVEQELAKRCLPYHKDKYWFYQRKDINSLFTCLKAVVLNDQKSMIKLLKLPTYRIDSASIKTIEGLLLTHPDSFHDLLLLCAQNPHLTETTRKKLSSLCEMIKAIKNPPKSNFSAFVKEIWKVFVQEIKYDDDLIKSNDNFELLFQAMDYFEKNNPDKTLKDFVKSVEPFLEQDVENEFEKNDWKKQNDQKAPDNTINLMTIHTAKGLEFPCVFIIGLVDEVIPNSYGLKMCGNDVIMKNAILEEERCFFYVAITRAKRYLFLTSYKGFNEKTKAAFHKSRFLEDISRAGLLKLKYSQKRKLGGKNLASTKLLILSNL